MRRRINSVTSSDAPTYPFRGAAHNGDGRFPPVVPDEGRSLLRLCFRLASLVALALLSLPIPARAEPISPEWASRWRADLAFAADSLPAAHPNFFHAVSRASYRAALDSLAARLPQLAQHEIVVELARIIALVGDGHTRLTFPFDPGTGFFTGHASTATPKIPGLVFRHYPIRLGLFADTLWVTQADSSHRDLLGGRVVRLGDLSAAAAVAAVSPVISRDNDNQMRNILPNWLVCPEILQARGVVVDVDRAPIVVEKDGAQLVGVLSPVAAGSTVRWLDVRVATQPPFRDRHPERSHWFERIPGTGIFYARYRQVRDDEKESVAQFADSLFAAIDAAHADRLVLDLRGNMGGNGFLNGPVVQHVIRAERLWQPAGLWALIDRGTFSAAVMFAADLELRTPTLFVGEKTGGHPNSYGDSRRIVLPETGITVRVSSLFWQLTGPQDHRDGITPHIQTETRFGDWRANHDPALEIALTAPERTADFGGSWSGEIGWHAERLPLQLELVHHASQWSGTIDLPADELEHEPLAAVRVVSGRLSARWNTKSGQARTFRGMVLGDRMIGMVHYGGLDFCVVLARKS